MRTATSNGSRQRESFVSFEEQEGRRVTTEQFNEETKKQAEMEIHKVRMQLSEIMN
ncbi:MAG: hypothetical protein KBD00_05480 [Candidatus Peribacteraceae bacterium]|nr:hypothetical protein [Candidatus Peribacteraceae bacterium]